MKQILLLEPDKVLGQIYAKALEMNGYEVKIVASAQSAIASADKLRPNIMIMELQLVNHSGVEFLYEFRSYLDWQAIPIIILTNVPASEFDGCQQLLNHELNVAAYMYKPETSLKKLLRSVGELMPVEIEV